MSIKVYINGKLYDKSEAKISVYDHGLLYGDGVFEGIRVYSGKVFKLREHIDRLYESARHIELEIPIGKDEMMEAVQSTVAANKKRDGYIRLVLTRGAGGLGLDPRKCTDPQIIVIVDDIKMFPQELYDNGMEIVTAATMRTPANALDPRVKSLNYLNNIMAKMEAIRAGCMEAVMLNQRGEVCECTGDNIFIVKNGALKTPPIDAGILEGVTRRTILELARAAEMPALETAVTRHDLYVADECFVTGTGAELMPIVKCDGRLIGTGKPGPITRKLRDRFQNLIRE